MIDGTVAPDPRPGPTNDPNGGRNAQAPGPLRLGQVHKWWASKVGPLLGVTYLSLTLFPLPTDTAAVRLAALVWSACLLASVAYIVNDWADRDADRRAGKQSLVMGMGRGTAVVLMTAPAALALLPWYVIGLPPAGWAALVGIIVLPHLYSDRPIRWKEHGAMGLVADMLLAHVCPTLFVLAAFDGLVFTADPARVVVVVSLLVWSVAVGLRGIIDHQLSDARADQVAGTRTWALSVGPAGAREVANQALIIEVTSLITILGGLTLVAPATAALFYVTAAAAGVGRLTGVWNRDLRATTSGPIFGVLWISYVFWLPFAALLGLVAHQLELAPLVLIHLVLFRSVAWPWVRNVAGYGRWTVKSLLGRGATVVRHRMRHRIRDGIVRGFNWLRHRLPDHIRRAWYHGLKPIGHRTHMWWRYRRRELHPWRNLRRQFRRAGRVVHRASPRSHPPTR